jgi:hypothetical protein
VMPFPFRSMVSPRGMINVSRHEPSEVTHLNA